MRSLFLLSLLGLVAGQHQENNTNDTTATTTTTTASSNATTTTTVAAAATTTTTAASGTSSNTTSNSGSGNTTAAAVTGNTDVANADFGPWDSSADCATILSDGNLQSLFENQITNKVTGAAKAMFSDCKPATRRQLASHSNATHKITLTVSLTPKAGTTFAVLKTNAETAVDDIVTAIKAAFSSATGYTVTEGTGFTKPTAFTKVTVANKATGTVTLKFFTDAKCATSASASQADVTLTLGASTCTSVAWLSFYLKALSYQDRARGAISMGTGTASTSCNQAASLTAGQCVMMGTGKYMTATVAGSSSSTSGAVSTGLGAAAALTAAVLMF